MALSFAGAPIVSGNRVYDPLLLVRESVIPESEMVQIHRVALIMCGATRAVSGEAGGVTTVIVRSREAMTVFMAHLRGLS
jgi:hypothetical protein